MQSFFLFKLISLSIMFLEVNYYSKMYDNDKMYLFDCLHIFQIFLSLFMFSNVVEILETHLEGIFKSDRSNVLVTRPQPNNGIFC